MMKILTAFLNIDRRIMYGLLILILVVLLLAPIKKPIAVTRAVSNAYDAVEAVKPDKIAIISIVWSSSTMAENGPQTEAIIRHLFRGKIKFAILSWDQQGAKLARGIAQKVSKEMGMTYGIDWCDFGFKPPYLSQILPALGKDFPGTVGKDYKGVDAKKLPMMRGVETMKDVGLVAEITPSGTLDSWIAFVQGVHGTPIIYAPTLVMVPEAFNPLDAGQIKGMLPGLPGAGQYEQLLNYEGLGRSGASALSGAHLLIVILIILGNIGMFASRRVGASSRERRAI